MIRCTDVVKVYQQGENRIIALAGVSLEIPHGAFAAVMGQSGSGKSTLLHLIGGLDRPSSGELLVDGRLIGQMADDQVTLFRRNQIGFIFQFFNLLPTLTAVENIALPFVLYILTGINRSLHELRNQMQPIITKLAVLEREVELAPRLAQLEAEGRIVKQQLKLMDGGAG